VVGDDARQRAAQRRTGDGGGPLENSPYANPLGRWATGTTQLGAQRIQAGGHARAGHRRPSADPHVRREAPDGNQAHPAFGHGPHPCPFPAQETAEIIARTSVEVLRDRLPDTTLAVDESELVCAPTIMARGLLALPVVFRTCPGTVDPRLVAARPDSPSAPHRVTRSVTSEDRPRADS
jgi:hypothetical protein